MEDLKQNESLLDKDVQYIKGVGPQKVKFLHKLGIFKIEDVITYFPRTYEDRSKVSKINELEDGNEALVECMALSNVIEINARRLKIYKLLIADETGKMEIIWYNQSYLKNIFKRGNRYKFFGKVSIKNGELQMLSPVFDENGLSNNTGKVIPIYPLTYGLSQFTIRKIIENTLEEVQKNKLVLENLPEYIIKRYNLYNRNMAIGRIHFPKDFKDFEMARKRLVFEELFLSQIKLLSLKSKYQKETGIEFNKNIKISEIISNLPFKLTNAQLRVLGEIECDMESEKIMNRLVQGDVGSRKNYCSYMCGVQSRKIWLSSGYDGTYSNTCKST